jgi:hypothetical protein
MEINGFLGREGTGELSVKSRQAGLQMKKMPDKPA